MNETDDILRRMEPVLQLMRDAIVVTSADLDPPGPVVLFIGTLTRRKGVDLLIDAFERLLETSPSAVLVLMGPRTAAEDSQLIFSSWLSIGTAPTLRSSGACGEI